MSVEIIKLVNGRATKVSPQEALKPAQKSDEQRLSEYVRKRGDESLLKGKK